MKKAMKITNDCFGIGSYRYRFTDEDLVALKAFCRGRLPVYCLFNNVAMIADTRRFMKRIGTKD